jgi:hypothetical protein
MAGFIMAGQTTNYLFDYPTSTDYVKDGATAIETLADDVDATLFTALGGAYPGLRLIKKQTVGSGVSSVTVTGAFSATYQNYKILYTDGVASATNDLNITLGGITTGYFSSLQYASFTGTTPLAANVQNAAVWNYNGVGQTSGIHCDTDIYNPFASIGKQIKSIYNTRSGNTGVMYGYNASTTSATAFTIATTNGTITGGTIYVYGYGTS